MKVVDSPVCEPGTCICCKSADSKIYFDWETDCVDGRVYICEKCAKQMAIALNYEDPEKVEAAKVHYISQMEAMNAYKEELESYQYLKEAIIRLNDTIMAEIKKPRAEKKERGVK